MTVLFPVCLRSLFFSLSIWVLARADGDLQRSEPGVFVSCDWVVPSLPKLSFLFTFYLGLARAHGVLLHGVFVSGGSVRDAIKKDEAFPRRRPYSALCRSFSCACWACLPRICPICLCACGSFQLGHRTLDAGSRPFRLAFFLGALSRWGVFSLRRFGWRLVLAVNRRGGFPSELVPLETNVGIPRARLRNEHVSIFILPSFNFGPPQGESSSEQRIAQLGAKRYRLKYYFPA